MDLDIKIGDYDTMFYILKKDAYMKCLREIQKRNLMELMGSSLLNAFSEQDYFDVIQIFNRVIERLEKIEKGGEE